MPNTYTLDHGSPDCVNVMLGSVLYMEGLTSADEALLDIAKHHGVPVEELNVIVVAPTTPNRKEN